MAKEGYLISDIKERQENWTAKVVVAEKFPPKIGQTNAVTYQALTLMDVEGFTIRTTIYEQHIAPFHDTLKLGKTYLLSNANVRKAPLKYQRFEDELQWTLAGACSVIEIDEPHYNLIFRTINLVQFDQLPSFRNENAPITTMGIVIAAKPLRPQPTKRGDELLVRDFVLMDKSFQTVNLRLWSSYAEHEAEDIANLMPDNPIVRAKNVTVNSHDGLSLSSINDTCLYIDTPFEEVLAYKKWIQENKEAIDDIKIHRPYLTPKRIEADEDTVAAPINKTQHLPIKIHCWIKAEAKVKRTSSPYWYMACSNCFTAASTTVAGESYSCRYCTENNAIAIPRARAEVELSDITGTISASMMGPIAEYFFQASATKLMGLTRTKTTIDDNACLDLNNNHLFYIKSTANRQWSADRGKSILPRHNQPPNRFEIVGIDIYNPDKHKNINLQHDTNEIQTEAASSTLTSATVDIAASSPKAKRALFGNESPPSPTNKKLLSKMD